MPTKPIRINYQLKRRFEALPKALYDEIYKSLVYDTPGGSGNRWKSIIEDNVRDIYMREAMVICEKIGCTMEELSDPRKDLYYIWQKAQKEHIEAVLAAELGMA